MPWLEPFDRLLARDAGDPGPEIVTIDDPTAGRVAGAEAVQAFLAESAAWLRARKAVVRTIATTVDGSRAVGEYEVDLDVRGQRLTLPLAAMAEGVDGSIAIRIYHSQWPLLGHHVLRPPLLAADAAVHESDVVGTYQAALAAGDTAAIVATFEPDGCFREPAGPQFRVCGAAALTAFYERFFSAGGGIVLEHCTVTEDGVRTALEFNAVRWGGTALPAQAGIAVYERGRSGRIAHARVYDDVAGPVE